jgi:hypothetical protein
MGKRSTVFDERSVEDDALEVEEVVSYDEVVEVETERVQLVYPARITRIGQTSGKEYVWDKAGAIVDVLKEDVPQLLKSHIGTVGCCGSSKRGGNMLFQVV